MLTRWFRRTRLDGARPSALGVRPSEAPLRATGRELAAEGQGECPTACALSHCGRGRQAVIVRVACESADACRLRALGVYEGARVDVVDCRNGLLLEVRGSRIALGTAVAAAIAVIPVS